MYAADAVLLNTLCKGSLQCSKAVKKLVVVDNEGSVIDNECKARTVNVIIVGETEFANGLEC